MNNEIIARIDVSTPSGRKIARELAKHKKAVKVEYPLPEGMSGSMCTHKEIFHELLNDLSEDYGCDMQELVKL